MIDPGHRNLFATIQDTASQAHPSIAARILLIVLVSIAMGAWFL